MAMNHDDIAHLKESSDITKAARREAIEQDGEKHPLFDDECRRTLQGVLSGTFRIDARNQAGLISAFAKAGSDDDADLNEKITDALTPHVNRNFLRRHLKEVVTVVEAAVKARDARIVEAGGPPHPGPGFTMA